MNIPVGIYGTDTDKQDLHLELETFQHTFVLGVTRSGKSTFIEDIIIQNIRAGLGCGFIDFHATSIRRILRYIPKAFSRKVFYFHPLAKKVPGFNFFAFAEPDKAVENLLAIMKSYSGLNWGPETEHVMRMAATAVVEVEPNPTILHVYLFLVREAYRVWACVKSQNPLVKDFYQQFDVDLRKSERMVKFTPAINKLAPFVHSVIRTIFGQSDSIDLIKLMDENYIILIDLDKGKIGDIAASLIGAAFMSYLQLRAMERKSNKRTDFPWFIDEFQNACHGVNWVTFFAELAKYGIRLWLATQSITQIPEQWLDPILTNCSSGNIIAFAVGSVDAERMEKEFGRSRITQEELIYENDYTFSIRTRKGKRRHFYKSVAAYAPLKHLPQGQESNWRDVLKNSRMRWGKNRKDEDLRIQRILRN